MLEGLEISVLNLSEVKHNNENLLRIEAEYFKKEYLKLEKKSSNFLSIKSTRANITCGPFGSNLLDTLYVDEGVLIVRPFNLKKLKVENDNVVFISKENIKANDLKTFQNGCLLFSRVGDIKTGILNRDIATISPNIIAVDFNNEKLSKYLAVFFETKYGFSQIKRQLKVSAQPTVSTQVIGNLKFPKTSNNYVEKISELVDYSFDLENLSQQTYTQAENLLLEELGLQNFAPNKNSPPLKEEYPQGEVVNINIKSFADSFGTSGRLDAEYYQPKYEKIENILKSKGYTKLEEICSHINYGTVPTSPYTKDDTGIPYIKGLNLKSTLISKHKLDRIINTENLSEKFYTKKGDIIISQMGTVGDVGVVREEKNWLFASFTIRARLKSFDKFNPTFIGLYIQNIAKPYYLYRNIAQASVRQNTDLPTIRNLYIPNISLTKQQQIANLIEKSFALKKQSEHLLEVAKTAVEIAIEQNEEVALAYIKQETKK